MTPIGRPLRIEICVDTAAGVQAARDGGADRVELCRDLACGGLTPPPDLIAMSLPLTPPDGIQILIRSRPGDFVYSEREVQDMCHQIEEIGNLIDAAPVDVPYGFVAGALTGAGAIDLEAVARFREAAGTRRLTFHRAFDQVADRAAALEALVHLGYQRILTTGGSRGAADQEGLIRLVSQAADRIVVLASGGLRSINVADVAGATGVREVHMRAPLHSGNPEGTDPAEVERIVRALYPGLRS